MKIGPLDFRPIDLSTSSEICILFREDSFIVSFGDSKKFYEDDQRGAQRYIDWLRKKSQKDPASVVHIWEGSKALVKVVSCDCDAAFVDSWMKITVSDDKIITGWL